MTPWRVDGGLPDGVRDRMRWSRFGTPGWLTGGALLLLAVALLHGSRPDARARGDAIRAGFGVVLEAQAISVARGDREGGSAGWLGP